MKSLTGLLMIVASLGLSAAAWGQEALSETDVQQLVQKLTSQPRKTWISVGTITATHQEYGASKTSDEDTIQKEIDKEVQQYQNDSNKKEKTAELQKKKLDAISFNVRYKLSNEHSMSSTHTVKYDNGRFSWAIDVSSRQDSVQPDATLAGNPMVRRFDLNVNRRRVFTWDGQEYTTYSSSRNVAEVDAANRLPHAVTGPLTAGLIPWGYGGFSADALKAAQVSATRDGDMIDMTISREDGASANLTLDSTKAYAVTEATVTSAGMTVTYTCSGYQQVAGNWIPSSVTVERKTNSFSNKLPTSEQWSINSISTTTPTPDSFRVSLAPQALVEYWSPLAARSAVYVQSNTMDTRRLLADRLAFVAGAGARAQNCATAAVQEVASEFGKSIAPAALAGLVGPDGRTSLYDLKQLAESQGLYCQAVKADLATLRTLPGVKVILHHPGRGHFVVLSEMDDHNVWLVDLSNKRFCYRQSAASFSTRWSQGTALLLSTRPIPHPSAELPDAALASITGGGWQCNTIIQEAYVGYCDGYITGCSGAVTAYYERWGCGWAESGECDDSQLMMFSEETPCIWDPWYECSTTGEWYYYLGGACG